MKLFCSTILKLSLASAFLIIQSAWAEAKPVTINDETLSGKFLGTYIEYLKDDKGVLTIDDVQKEEISGKFLHSTKDILSFGFTPEPYWFRLSVINPTLDKKNFYIEIGYHYLDDIEIYIPDGKNFQVRKAGDLFPYNKREYDNQNFIFNVDQNPGQTTYYIRIKTTSSVNVPISLWNGAKLIKKNDFELLLNAMFLGIAFVMMIYNLFIYIAARDLSYLLYSLLIAAFIPFQLSMNGLGFRFIWPETLWLCNSLPLIMPLANVAAMLFPMAYLKTRTNTPVIHKIMVFLTFILLGLASMSYVLPYSTIMKICTIAQGLTAIFLLYLAIVYLLRKSRAAIFFFPGWFLMLVGTGLTTTKNLGMTPNNFFTVWGYQMAMASPIILFSFGLADKLSTLKNQLKDYSQNLEVKVEKRTEELNAAMKEMTIMNDQLTETRDHLWGEMQLAKKIQTVLLPSSPSIPGYDISAYMATADEVGGDYYDIINVEDINWLVIGDVSGHGVPAGLVMMMVQTSIHIAVTQSPHQSPSELLSVINTTITQNIKKLGEDKYMTITVMCAFDDGKFTFSGLHQDIMIFRSSENNVELVQTSGMWLGIMDDLNGQLDNSTFELNPGDTMLVFTDGITEAWKKESSSDQRSSVDSMYGEIQLREVFRTLGNSSTEEIKDGIVKSLLNYNLNDDVTMVVLKKLS